MTLRRVEPPEEGCLPAVAGENSQEDASGGEHDLTGHEDEVRHEGSERRSLLRHSWKANGTDDADLPPVHSECLQQEPLSLASALAALRTPVGEGTSEVPLAANGCVRLVRTVRAGQLCFGTIKTACSCAACFEADTCDSRCGSLPCCTVRDPQGNVTMSEAVGALCRDPANVLANMKKSTWHSA